MAIIEVENSSEVMLALWLEPLGEDRWLRPGQKFRIQTDYMGQGMPFSVTTFTQAHRDVNRYDNLTVWVMEGDCHADVTDGSGNLIECGHQRPEELDRMWRERSAGGGGIAEAR